jgi:hypothetical protein
MLVEIKEGITDKGQREFYLKSLHRPEDLDVILDILNKDPSMHLVDIVDGIWFKAANFDHPTIGPFRVMYHDDVGTYAYSLQQTEQANNLLRDVLKLVVITLNQA